MKKFLVTVIQEMYVELDETKFTPEFMEEYDKTIGFCENLQDHAENIAMLTASGIIDGINKDEFVEGYGPLGEMSISCHGIIAEVYTHEYGE